MTPASKNTNEESLSPLKDDPMVSILVNCKNGKRTIGRCLEGILAQSYPRIEVVFQDGGSTDGTLDIVKAYINRQPGLIRLKAEQDSCAEDGFFRGLKSCKGDIIILTCVDEELLPDALAWGVKQLKSLPLAGAVYGDVYVTNSEGKTMNTWFGRPFSLKGYLCRKIDPPLAGSFFRREAILGAGLLTRKWTWGIGEFEFWLRIGLKYPIHYVPGVIAKYAFHTNTASYGQFLDDEQFVLVRKAFFDKFFAETDLPESIRGMKEQAIAGLHLFIGEVLYSLKGYSQAQKHLQKALDLIPNGSRLVDLTQKLSIAGQDLRTHILAHLANLPPQKIVCYGAGNDFMELLSSGVFEGHSVLAVVDNFRPKGERVCEVPIISEAELGQVEHDMVVVTSSKWAHQCRAAATRWSIQNPPYIPVI